MPAQFNQPRPNSPVARAIMAAGGQAAWNKLETAQQSALCLVERTRRWSAAITAKAKPTSKPRVLTPAQDVVRRALAKVTPEQIAAVRNSRKPTAAASNPVAASPARIVMDSALEIPEGARFVQFAPAKEKPLRGLALTQAAIKKQIEATNRK